MAGFNIDAIVCMTEKETTTNRVDLKNVSLITGTGYRGAYSTVYSKEELHHKVTINLDENGVSTLAIFEVYGDGSIGCLSQQALTNIDSWLINHLKEDGTEENYNITYAALEKTWNIYSHDVSKQEED